jgi:superfamily I DNA/RNA helicase/RecB family exonuclease
MKPVIDLDPRQRAVVDAVARPGHGPLLVLAGPGTGKTTTIVEAVAARVASGTSPERILTLTFSRRAAAELRARIARRLQRTVSAPLAWTFHGFGFSLMGDALIPDDLGRGLRLMPGPQQELAVRELLAHDLEVGRVPWPEALSPALRTRGFTEQVRTFMATARSLGLDPEDVATLDPARPDWAAAAAFMSQYLEVLDGRGVLDYAELVVRAVAYAESPDGRRRLRDRYDLVVVDEYQDTDPSQERLLQAVAGDGRDLCVVGDPDQSIYAFRGADVRGITEFPVRFRTQSDDPAPILTLSVSRRCSRAVLAASRHVTDLLGPAGSLPVAALREHRDLQVPADQPDGAVQVLLFATADREAAAIAELLRREHLHGGTPWSDMAVLVRSGVSAIPVVERALVVAGVPVDLAADELPLHQHPALWPLLSLLAFAAMPGTPLDADTVHRLLLSPVFGATPAQLRALGRALRDTRRGDGLEPPPSPQLIADAVHDEALLATVASSAAEPARRLAAVLDRLRGAAGWSAHEVLWSLWDGSPWAAQLVTAASGSGPEAVDAAQALDAVVALVDLAARNREQAPRSDVASFLAEVSAQEIPAGPLHDTGARGTGVRVMTAHRSKGLEWSVVVVAGVQADAWPDLRRRGSVLDADRLGADGLRPPLTVADLRREERRLFYVAATRARRRLVCTAVESPSDDGMAPSPFLDDLQVAVERPGATGHPLTLAGLVADLRATLVDPAASTELRDAAAARLARLADAEVKGRLLVPTAHPDRWWGGSDVTAPGSELEREPTALRLSGSQIETLRACPLQWYLSRRAHAEGGRGAAAGFGGVVHALADAVARGDLPADLDVLTDELDRVWGQLPYSARWEAEQQRREAVDALRRFLQWHGALRGRELVLSEESFEATFEVLGHSLVLSGRVDRLERDDAGFLVVVDLKTMRTPPTGPEVNDHLQLSTYRMLVGRSERFTEPVGAAELIQLRVPQRTGSPEPKVQRQQATDQNDGVLQSALEHAVSVITADEYPATPGPACRYCPFTLTCPAQPAGQEVIP